MIPKNHKEKKLLQAVGKILDRVKLMQEGKLAKQLAAGFQKSYKLMPLGKRGNIVNRVARLLKYG